jgi:hypothetical protein
VTFERPGMMFGSGNTTSNDSSGSLDDDVWDRESEGAADDGPTVVQDVVKDALWGDNDSK